MKDERRELFFYVIVTDKQINRENRLAQLFEEEIKTFYLGPYDKNVTNLISARFWKDQPAAIRKCEKCRQNGSHFDYQISNLSRQEFIDLIPSDLYPMNYCESRNIEFRKEELKYLRKIKNDLINDERG